MKTTMIHILILILSAATTAFQGAAAWPSRPADVPPPASPMVPHPEVRHSPAPEVRSHHRPPEHHPRRQRPYYHDELAPYGNWIELSSEEWIWRPDTAAANRHWRPYVDNGYWIKTGSGLYWHSNYRWGHIPFHYGRWTLHARYGWVWVPGRVWAPSWVCWRRYGSYYGWAPLPPGASYDSRIGFTFNGERVSWSFHFNLTDDHYVFVPSHHVYYHNVDSVCVPHGNVRRYYRHASPVRDIDLSHRHSYRSSSRRYAPSYPRSAYSSSSGSSRRTSGSLRVYKQKMRIPRSESHIVPPRKAAPAPRATKKTVKPSPRRSTSASSSSRRSGSIGSIFKSRIGR